MRNGAIDQLETLVAAYPAAANRVGRMLSVYVREMSREHPSEPVPNELGARGIEAWVEGLRVVRTDMQNAAQVFGRLRWNTDVLFEERALDWEDVNLQKMRLVEADWSSAKLIRAQAQGTDFFDVRMRKARLFGAQFQGARLLNVKMQGALAQEAQLQGVRSVDLRLQGADLTKAHLEVSKLIGANLKGARCVQTNLQGADLTGVILDKATLFGGALFRGAAVRDADFREVAIAQDQIKTMFGDATVHLPNGMERPEHFNIRYANCSEFQGAWRAWQGKIGFDPDDPATW